MSDRPRGVIIDETPPQEENPHVKSIKKGAQKVILAGLGVIAATTGAGLTLNAINTPHKPDEPSPRPTPALVDARTAAMPTPTPTQRPFGIPLPNETEEEFVERITPHLNFSDYLKMSKDDQEKTIRSYAGYNNPSSNSSIFLTVDKKSVKLHHKSDDKFGNVILELIDGDNQKKGEYPFEITVSPSGYKDMQSMWGADESGIPVPERTRFLFGVSTSISGPTEPPVIFPLERPVQK